MCVLKKMCMCMSVLSFSRTRRGKEENMKCPNKLVQLVC